MTSVVEVHRLDRIRIEASGPLSGHVDEIRGVDRPFRSAALEADWRRLHAQERSDQSGKGRHRTTGGAADDCCDCVTLLGVESAPIRFDRSGATWSVKASAFVDMAAAGVRGLNPDSPEPIHLDHTGHPAADRFALARASRSRVRALGLAWEDTSGRNNGQYAPFSWRNT